MLERGVARTTIEDIQEVAGVNPSQLYRPTPENDDEFVREMAKYASLGVDCVMMSPTIGTPATWIDGMAPVVAQLAELE